MIGDEMNGHVQARREWIRDKAARGDELAKREPDDVWLASVKVLLGRWGEWAIRCESGALGFASSCILAGSGDSYGFGSEVPHDVADADMGAIDAAVRRLPSMLKLAVVEFYEFGAGQSLRGVADRIGISDKTLAKYLAEAQRKIAVDIYAQFPQNPHQSGSGGSSPGRNQPVAA